MPLRKTAIRSYADLEIDETNREGVTQLFTQENAIAVMKTKDVYDLFERLNDACTDLANVLQNVSIKNS